MGQITTVNPATGEEITTFSTMDKNQVFELVGKARRAYPEWKKDYEKRRSYIYNLVEYLKKNKTKLAKVATTEMGKPISQSRAEVAKCALVSRYYAERAGEFLAPVKMESTARESYTRFDPLGIIFAVMDLGDPLYASNNYNKASIASFENYKMDMLKSPDEKQAWVPDEETLKAMYEAEKDDRIRRVKHDSMRSLYINAALILICIVLFLTHWCWMRRVGRKYNTA